MRVLCFGSLNIDKRYLVDHFVRKGETLSSERFQIFGGGKGLNQSIAMARAGASVWHAGAVGEDGGFLLDLLDEAGVHTEYVRIIGGMCTGHAVIQNDREGDNCIILYGGTNHAITREQVDQVIGRFGEDTVLVLQNEISELDYIISKARERGLQIVLNPSPVDQKLLTMSLRDVDYLILNEVEAGQLAGEEAVASEPEEAARQLTERYPDMAVVLTLGSRGAVYMDRRTVIRQEAYIVDVADTTAAGDTFTGYFIAGLLRQYDLHRVMEYASKAAAIAVTRHGAAPSIPVWAEVEAF